MKLQRLRELAFGATQVKWQHVFDDEDYEYKIRTEFTSGAAWQIGTADNEEEASYIAAACPANILPILESYEELLSALNKYGKHEPLCAAVGGYGYCDCGFEEAITNAAR